MVSVAGRRDTTRRAPVAVGARAGAAVLTTGGMSSSSRPFFLAQALYCGGQRSNAYATCL
jgi:hypothetical protein